MVCKASQGGLSSWCWISGLGFPMWCLNSSFSLERIPKLMMSAPPSPHDVHFWVTFRAYESRLDCFSSPATHLRVFFFFFFFIFFIVQESFCILQVFLRIVLQVLITLVCSWEKVSLEFSYSTILILSSTNLYFNIVHFSISPFYN